MLVITGFRETLKKMASQIPQRFPIGGVNHISGKNLVQADVFQWSDLRLEVKGGSVSEKSVKSGHCISHATHGAKKLLNERTHLSHNCRSNTSVKRTLDQVKEEEERSKEVAKLREMRKALKKQKVKVRRGNLTLLYLFIIIFFFGVFFVSFLTGFNA